MLRQGSPWTQFKESGNLSHSKYICGYQISEFPSIYLKLKTHASLATWAYIGYDKTGTTTWGSKL